MNDSRLNRYFQMEKGELVKRSQSLLSTVAPVSPANMATADALSESTGIPPLTLASDPAGMQARNDDARVRSILENSPGLARFMLEDAGNAAAAKDDLQQLATVESRVQPALLNPEGTAAGRAVERGALRVQQTGPALESMAIATAIEDSYKTQEQLLSETILSVTGLDELPSTMDFSNPVAAEQSLREMGFPANTRVNVLQILEMRTNEARNASENMAEYMRFGSEQILRLNDLSERVAALPMSRSGEAMKAKIAEIDTDGGFWAASGATLATLASSPFEGAAFLLETAGESAPIMATSILAAVVTRSPAVGAALMMPGSIAQETGASTMEFLAEQGVRLETPEDALLLLNNAQLLQDAADRGLTRGVVIGAFEMLGMGLAMKAILDSPTGTIALQTAIQMGTGAGGEAGARLAAGQELDGVEITLEGLAEGVMVAGEAPIVYMGHRQGIRRREEAAVRSSIAAGDIENLNAVLSDTEMRKQNPKRFRKFLQAQGTDRRNLYLDATAAAELPTAQQQALGLTTEAIAQAADRGGVVAISMTNYAMALDENLAKVFSENATFEDNAMSVIEARAFEAEEKAERGAELSAREQFAVEVTSLRQGLEKAITDQLTVSGSANRNDARTQARLVGAFYATMAVRTNDTSVFNRFNLEVRGPASELTDRTQQRRTLDQELLAETESFASEMAQTDTAPAIDEEQRVALENGTIPAGLDSGAFMFATADSTRVPLDQIRPIRARPQGIANARPLMTAAALNGSRRQPLTVRQEDDGTYTLLDGNSTYAVLNEAGVTDVPVRVVTDDQFVQDQAMDAARKVLKDPGKKPRYIELAVLPEATAKQIEVELALRQPYTSADAMIDTPEARADQDELNAALEEALIEVGLPYSPATPKEMESAQRKFQTKYGGEHRRLTDTVRQLFSPETPSQAKAVLDRLAETYTILDEGYGTSPVGYTDAKVLIVMPSGRIGELQILPPGMQAAKKNPVGGHADYAVSRDENLPAEVRAAATQRQLDNYTSALSALPSGWAPVIASGLRSNPALAALLPSMNALASSSETSLIRGSRMISDTSTAQSPVDENARPLDAPGSTDTARSSVMNQDAMVNTPVVGGDTSNIGAGAADVNAPRQLFQSGLPLFDTPLQIDGKVTVLAIGEAMTKDHLDKHGRKFYPEDDEADYQQVLEDVSGELDAQLQRPGSGAGWYSKDVELAIRETAKVYPEVDTPEGRAVWLTFAGVFSNGLDPSQAWEISAEAFEYWVRFGEIPINRGAAAERLGNEVRMTSFKKKDTGEVINRPAGWGVRNPANEQQLTMFKNLVEREGGPVQAVEWMLSPQSADAINEIVLTAQNTPRFKTKKEREGPAQWGALMLSEKLGRYTMGLHGFQITEDDTTVDLWYTRTYRRLTGRLLDKPIGKEGVAAQPDPARGGIERKTIFRMTGDLSRMFGGIPAGDVQAMLWFFEKRLWGAQGLRTDEGTNSAGARRLLEKRGVGFDDGDAGAAQDQRAGQEPTATDGQVDGRTLYQRGIGPDGLPEVGGAAQRPAQGAAAGTDTGDGAAQQPVTGDDLQRLDDPEFLQDFLQRPGWAVVTATQEDLPDSIRDARNVENNEYMRQSLQAAGIPFVTLTGTYQGVPQGSSFLIVADEATASQIGKRALQDSILTHEGLVYTSRPRPTTPATGGVVTGQAARAQDFFSETEGGTAFAMDLNFSQGPGVPVIPEGYTIDPTRPQIPVRPDGLVELHHWSDQELDNIDPAFAGTGPLNGVERRRGARLGFFGINPRTAARAPGTGYVKESKLGPVEHVAFVDPARLYPIFEDPDGIAAGKNISDAEDAIKAAGYLGYYTTDDGSGRAPLGNVAALFEAVPVKPIDRELSQSGAESARGAIFIDPKGVENSTTIIEMFTSKDSSTFLHETGHFFLEIFQTLAADPNAPASIKEDMAAINLWLGREADDTSTFTTEQQETWAETFETYLMEGRAPSPSLKVAFDQFASWLTYVYQNIVLGQGLARPSPEISEVMDRMLATDEEIAIARAELDAEALFSDIPPGMTQSEWEPYAKAVKRAAAESKGRTLKGAMAKIRRRRTAEYQKRYAEILAETRARLAAQPLYRAIAMLGANTDGVDSKGRMDSAQLVAMFGKDILAALTKGQHKTRRNLYVKGGVDPRVLAESFGFETVADMIEQMKGATPIADAAAAEAETQIENELGDPNDDVSIREEAEASLKTASGHEVVAREAAHLSAQADAQRGTQGGRRGRNRWQVQNAAAKTKAMRLVGDMQVREIMGYRQFLKASQKAARDAQRALAKVVAGAEATPSRANAEALAEAANFKRQQLLNDHMYRIARDKAMRYKSARKRVMRLNKAKAAARIGATFMDAINSLTRQYSFENMTQTAVRQQADIRVLHTALLASNRGAELAIDQDILDRTTPIHYTELTVTQMDGLVNAIDNLAHMGRQTARQIAQEEQRDLSLVLDDIEASAATNLRERGPAREKIRRSKWPATVREFMLHVVTTDSSLNDLDGNVSGTLGVAYKAIKLQIDKAIGRADQRRQKAAAEIAALYKDHLGGRKQIDKMRKDERFYPELNTTLTRLGLISLALNSGNAGNWSRITGDEGNRYSPEAVRGLLARELTEAEWRFVQGVWDYIGSYWPEIEAQERKYTGVTPERVQADLQIEGAPDFVTGGYYPIDYDTELSGTANDIERANLATEGTGGRAAKAQTASGHTKERQAVVSKDLAVNLDLSIIDRHVYEVIHALELRGPVRDAARIIYTDKFFQIMTKYGRAEDLAAMKAWLEDVAVGERAHVYGASRWFRWMRSGFTLAAIGFNMSTVLIQPLGLLQSGVVVGNRALARGYASTMRQGHARMHRMAVAKSTIMEERIRTFDKDISQITQEITQNEALQRGYGRLVNQWMPYAYLAMQHMQYWVVDLPTWVASYEQALRNGETDADAVSIADRDVRLAQGSGLMSDRGMLERGRVSPRDMPSEFPRLFTVLASYMFAKFNVAYIKARGTNFANPAQAARFVVDMMMLFMFEAVLISLLRNGWPDEEEDETWAGMIARETGHTMMGSVPFVREVSAGIRGFDSGGAYASYTGSVGDFMVNSLSIAAAPFDEDRESAAPTRREFEGIISLGGTMLMLPTNVVNKLADGMFTNTWDLEDDAFWNSIEALSGLPVGGDDES